MKIFYISTDSSPVYFVVFAIDENEAKQKAAERAIELGLSGVEVDNFDIEEFTPETYNGVLSFC